MNESELAHPDNEGLIDDGFGTRPVDDIGLRLRTETEDTYNPLGHRISPAKSIVRSKLLAIAGMTQNEALTVIIGFTEKLALWLENRKISYTNNNSFTRFSFELAGENFEVEVDWKGRQFNINGELIPHGSLDFFLNTIKIRKLLSDHDYSVTEITLGCVGPYYHCERGESAHQNWPEKITLFDNKVTFADQKISIAKATKELGAIFNT